MSGASSALPREVQAELEQRLGARVLQATPLAGGDINRAFAVELAGLGRIFLKTLAGAPPGFFAAEARGLDWLREPGAIALPRVLAVSEAFLALEFIPQGRAARNHDETLGAGLARLHRASPGVFGFPTDNFIGTLPQANTPAPTWAEFYWSRRLEPQLARAVKLGRASHELRKGFEKLRKRLPELVGEEESPSRLHGDLWGGNACVTEEGAPCLIDPAVYGGHREIDLAMMRLFGGFSERVFAAYHAEYPLAPGASSRVRLYQLYPLLVHTNLFGGSYARSVEAALAEYL